MTFVQLENGALINPEHIVKLVPAAKDFPAAGFLYLSTGEKLEVTQADLDAVKAL
jgi:hypothetical protein